MSFKTIKRVLLKNGWVEIRVNGSHHQFKKVTGGTTVPVPHHGDRDLSIGVIKSLEKATGLSFNG